MLNMLKDYDAAEEEYKAYILRKATTLMVNVSTLGNVLMKKEIQEMADLAYRKAADLCRLFGLWSGFIPVNSFTRAEIIPLLEEIQAAYDYYLAVNPNG